MYVIQNILPENRYDIQSFLNTLKFLPDSLAEEIACEITDSNAYFFQQRWIAVDSVGEVVGIVGVFPSKHNDTSVMMPFYITSEDSGNLLIKTVLENDRNHSFITSLFPQDTKKKRLLRNYNWKLEDILVKYFISTSHRVSQSSSKLELTPLNQGDPNLLRDLINECFKTVLNTKYLTLEDVQRMQQDFLVEQNNSWILNKGDEYIGYILTMKSGEIESIGVLEGYRKNHLGKFLLEKVIKTNYRQKYYGLILSSNIPSIALFKSFSLKREVYCKYYRLTISGLPGG